MKLGSNLVEDHPQLSHNRHPKHGALVGATSLWPTLDALNLERVTLQHNFKVEKEN
jgi:hypothetical protein